MPYYFTPFRKGYQPHQGSETGCAFCDSALQSQVIAENAFYFWVVNYYPRYEGHTMLVPKKHLETFEEESDESLVARHRLLRYARTILSQLYPESGVEVFLQTGAGSASSIKHLHWHVLPSSPTDELRGFEKMGYFDTTEEGKEKVIVFPMKIERAREDLRAALRVFVDAQPYSL